MSHTIRDKAKLLARVRRIRGQVEALERALDAEKECADVLHLIVVARGGMTSLMMEVMEDHIQSHIANPNITTDAERQEGADELIDIIRAYLK